ncbi:hypothetical protein D3C78_1558690 [compost metagenome]
MRLAGRIMSIVRVIVFAGTRPSELITRSTSTRSPATSFLNTTFDQSVGVVKHTRFFSGPSGCRAA